MTSGCLPCLVDRNNIQLINYHIHDRTHENTGDNIEAGVLLDEYGGKNNGNTQD